MSPLFLSSAVVAFIADGLLPVDLLLFERFVVLILSLCCD